MESLILAKKLLNIKMIMVKLNETNKKEEIK
jgi:hypothetical protein